MNDEAADQATGCYEHAEDAQLYRDVHGKGIPITDEEAAQLLLKEEIHDPNAGAGTYRRFAERIGFVQVKVFDQTSSAGDWTFIVSSDNETWGILYQENRYPYHGFKYSLAPRAVYSGTAEDVIAQLAGGM